MFAELRVAVIVRAPLSDTRPRPDTERFTDGSSLSAMVMVISSSSPAMVPDGSVPSSITTVSAGSSTSSSTTVNVVVPLAALFAMSIEPATP